MQRPTTPVLAVLALLCAAAGPPPEAERLVPGGQGGFVSDGAGGCWLWASGIRAGAEGLTASWTGPCPDGPAEGEGRGEVRWREDGGERAMIYEGAMRRGRNEGEGRLTITAGKEIRVVQQGIFRDDLFVSGRVELPRAGIVYEGGWSRSHPQGRGRLVLNGRVIEGDWAQGCLRVPQGWFSFTRPARECEGADT
ncbi:hypothetical protein GXW74_17425 [Roseomonas eburnea]|uniref:MORN repeat-containing protein n=1 Tax=Neoroseomonas eburnea TaxID=1346889 RepID=A0A9X9XEZ0_9PROT|nr:hypothetical protein [Neoroseomonas eburnea]MBR0682276.1 hypothetical protein [Neoroseomonas eburnea]